MLVKHLVLISLAAACDYTLYAQPQSTNIWAIVIQLDSVPSPYVFCLAGSTPTKRFTMEDTAEGCGSLCEPDNCEKQTIWLQKNQPCSVTSNLSFVNVTLSGRHHFREDCEEDWCTHCLNPVLLVEESGNYYTTIEHHLVPMDKSYQEWQSKCMWGVGVDVFFVFQATLSIIDSEIADVRYKTDSFAWLEGSSFRLIRSRILRFDLGYTFFYCYNAPFSFALIEDSYVTGLNRDHAYTPEAGVDGSFLFFWLTANLTIVRSTFTELVHQSSNIYNAMIRSVVDSYLLADTTFSRCVGKLFDLTSYSGADLTLRNVTIERNYAEPYMMSLYGSGVRLIECRVIDNLSKDIILVGEVTEIISGVFRNNKHLGWKLSTIFYFASSNSLPIRMENTVFEDNSAVDSSFKPYWSDYYLAQGLFTDTSLSTEKAIGLTSSLCFYNMRIVLYGQLEVFNVTITDTDSACDSLLRIDQSASDSFIHINDITVSTRADYATIMTCDANCVLQIQDSLFERAAILLNVGGNASLNVTNVTFQQASGDYSQSSAVRLVVLTASFWNCRWRHNYGHRAGALSFSGNVEVRNSEFFNNSGGNGAGDISVFAENNVFEVSSSNFTASTSLLNAGCILLQGSIAYSKVSDCIFSKIQSASKSIIKAAHNRGSVELRNLVFDNINSSSATLILVSVANAGIEATTVIENLQVRNSSFYRGIATEQGDPVVRNTQANFTGNYGTAIWVQAGRFSDSGSVYADNKGSGLCFFGSNTVTSFSQSVFRRNIQNETMGVLYAEGPNVQVSLQSCEFTRNEAKRASGVMQLLRGANVTFDGCEFSENQARNSMIFLQVSTVVLQRCRATYSFDMLNLEDSNAQVTSSTFYALQSTVGMFSLVRSFLALRSANFTGIQGAEACLLSAQSSNVSLTSVIIQRLACSEAINLLTSRLDMVGVDINSITCERCDAAVISSVEAEINMLEVNITECSAQILNAQSSRLSLSHCDFTHIYTEQEVGVLSCSDCDLLTVQSTTMMDIQAKSIGAIYISATNVTISRSSFSHISADDTGAIRVTAGLFELLDSHFSDITATGPLSSGGALRLSGGQLRVTGSSFERNKAWTGGAVQWVSGSLTQQGNYFRDNIAGFYGPNWASFPFALSTSSSFVFLHLERKLAVDLVDHFGQVVLSDSSSGATLSTNQSAVLSGQLQALALNGHFLFNEFSLFAEPGNNFTVTVTAGELKLDVIFVQRVCELGEIYKNKTCERCHTGTYSLILNGTACKLCPAGAECREGYKLFPKPTYWRPHINFPGALSCPWGESCAGHKNYTSQTGTCEELHTGRFCQSCEDGAGRRGRDRCTACHSDTAFWIQGSLLCVGLPMLWSIQAFTVTRDNNRLGVLLRLLVDYVQFMVLVVDYDLAWPAPLEYFYYLHRYLGNSLQTVLPLDCFLSDAFQIYLIAAALAPFTIIAFFAIAWGILRLIFKAIKHSASIFRAAFVNIVIVGVAYVYPFVVRMSFSAFLCETIEPGEQWVRANLAMSCWDKEHLKYALAASLPSLLLWGVGLPVLACLYLVRNLKVYRRNPTHLGFLWRGFKEQFTLWEMITMLCKGLVAVLYVFTANMNHAAQALLLIAMLSVVLLLQRLYQPYSEAVYNRLALLSLGVVWTTAYSGLYFNATDPSLLLLILVYCLHVWFVLSWIMVACGSKLLWVMCLRSSSNK